MYLLKNQKVPGDPSYYVRAAEDILLLFIHTHFHTAACHLYCIIPKNSVVSLATSVIASYPRLPQPDAKKKSQTVDSVQANALKLVSQGLLWHRFHDCIKEGEGDLLMVHWKFLMIDWQSNFFTFQRMLIEDHKLISGQYFFCDVPHRLKPTTNCFSNLFHHYSATENW